jgi:PIN domain nuclease of toxin-antitoxin system
VNDPDVVADASAVLALLKDEELGEFDPEHLVGAAISAVNFSGVLAKLGSGGLTEAEADAAVAALDLHVIALDEHQARSAVRLSPAVRRFGLSPADRACLALGRLPWRTRRHGRPGLGKARHRHREIILIRQGASAPSVAVGRGVAGEAAIEVEHAIAPGPDRIIGRQ